MPTQEILITAAEELHDILVAELAPYGFDAFTTDGDVLRGFRSLTGTGTGTEPSDEVRLASVVSRYGIRTPPRLSIHPDRNWNEEWESSIQAIRAGGFVIAPDWDIPSPREGEILIRINPKMSFGTGHHASTRIALELVARSIVAGDSVLDAGTGTGILAIASVRLGASRVLAFDNDASVRDNFLENVASNDVSGVVSFVAGTLAHVPDHVVDLIAANINRSAILDYLPDFVLRLTPGGRVVLSGLLSADRDIIADLAAASRLTIVDELTEGEWWGCTLTRVRDDNA